MALVSRVEAHLVYFGEVYIDDKPWVREDCSWSLVSSGFKKEQAPVPDCWKVVSIFILHQKCHLSILTRSEGLVWPAGGRGDALRFQLGGSWGHSTV